MSEFDVLNGKLDEILRRLGPAPAIVPEPGAGAQDAGAPRTMTEILYGTPRPAAPAAPVDAAVPRVGNSVPAIWTNERVVCDVDATTYQISSDSPKHGYMVTGRTGGYDARFNGTVGGTTIWPVNGVMTLTVDKPCQAVFAPIVN